MRTNRPHNLYQKLDQKLQLKSILQAFVAVTFLSACGIKGDLYQTPEQAVTPKGDTVVQDPEIEEQNISEKVESQPVTMLDTSQKKQAVEQTEQSTDQVKEQQ